MAPGLDQGSSSPAPSISSFPPTQPHKKCFTPGKERGGSACDTVLRTPAVAPLTGTQYKVQVRNQGRKVAITLGICF